MKFQKAALNTKLIFALTLVGFLCFAATADAATYTVTTTADSGVGSLRAMIAATNAAPTGSIDTINFAIPATDANCTNGICTITLTGGEIAIGKIGSSTLTISGTGAGSLVLSGNNTNRVYTFTSGNGGSGVTLNGLTVTGGKSTYGGAIFANANGTFIISNSVFTGNTATTGGNAGGAVYCVKCSVNNSTFSNNSAPSGNGGALVGASVANSIFTGNSASYGGAIYEPQVTSGGFNVTNSTFSNNSATGYGGAIYFDAGGSDFVNGTTFSGNTATSYGGAIYEFYCDVHITDTTITNNSSSNGDGGAMFIDRGSFYFTNSTASHNYSKYQGGGIYSYAPPSAYNSHILNTIISNNTSTTTSPDYYGNFQSLGYNIVGDGTGATITGTMTGNQIGTTNAPVDAKLAPLAYNGGFGLTRALLVGSPAVDAGTNTGDSYNVVPTLDQRGASRVGATDIGAFEANNTNFVATLPNGYTTLVYNSQIVPDSDAFTYTVTGGALPPNMTLTVTGNMVSVSGTPTAGGTYNFTVTGSDGANTTTTNYTITIISLAPTAASVAISGRAMSSTGRGIRNVMIRLTDGEGHIRFASTSAFGYYRFNDVNAGETVIITAKGKRFEFATPSQVLNVNEDASNVNFVAY